MSIALNLSSLRGSTTLREVLIHMYLISWTKSKRFHLKVNSSCSCWFLAAVLVHNGGALTRRLHIKLFKVAWNSSTNNSKTMYRTDLRIGEVIYEFVSPTTYQIFRFFHWTISILFFCCVTVKTIYSSSLCPLSVQRAWLAELATPLGSFYDN